jgi:hypothetical protein
VVARDESGPRYVSHYDARALRPEGFCVLERIGDGLRHMALDRRRRLLQRLAQVRDAGELLGQLLVLGFLALGADPGQSVLERFLLAA